MIKNLNLSASKCCFVTGEEKKKKSSHLTANVEEVSISAWNLTLVYVVNSNLSGLQPDVAAYLDEKCLIKNPCICIKPLI